MTDTAVDSAVAATAVPDASVQEKRTHPISPLVSGLAGIRNAIFPAVAAFIAMQDEPWAILAALAIAVVIILVSAGFAYLAWRRLTYIVGHEDIRVESGVVSRAARSVPFERIQDVSLEQSLLPRLFGLVKVKFETGAGGGDDLVLHYLAQAEGERLRDVIKARKSGDIAPKVAVEGPAGDAPAPEKSDVIFAMDEKRLFTFGFFEFSLAVFAVIAGLFQYAETFISVELWDSDLWAEWANGTEGFVSGLGFATQIMSILAGLLVFVAVGSITGIVRTLLRDWDFTLELDGRNFRRRRGMFTKTDVVMPAHRVQAIKLGTGFLRRRFGWHGLKFVSLAHDSGSASHDVAPFAQMEELRPIARRAGFAIDPQAGTEWHRGSRNYRIDSAIIEFSVFALIAIMVAIVFPLTEFASPWFAVIPLLAGAIFGARQLFLWRYDYNALDAHHFFVRTGWLAPKRDVASRVKLQSIEIARGPIAQRRGYATLALGLAGGTLNFEGLPFDRAVDLRAAILDSIAGTDFSELNDPQSGTPDQTRRSDQLGLSSNFAAT